MSRFEIGFERLHRVGSYSNGVVRKRTSVRFSFGGAIHSDTDNSGIGLRAVIIGTPVQGTEVEMTV